MTPHDAIYEYEVKSEWPIDQRFTAECAGCGDQATQTVKVGKVENGYGAEYDLCAYCRPDAIEIHAKEMEEQEHEN